MHRKRGEKRSATRIDQVSVPNVLFLAVDSLRADAVFGGHVETPHFDAHAGAGAAFTQCVLQARDPLRFLIRWLHVAKGRVPPKVTARQHPHRPAPTDKGLPLPAKTGDVYGGPKPEAYLSSRTATDPRQVGFLGSPYRRSADPRTLVGGSRAGPSGRPPPAPTTGAGPRFGAKS